MMKRRVFGMLLSLCLVLALIPAMAFAEDEKPKLTLSVPYTVNVVKGGSAEPGYAEFRMLLIEDTGENWANKGGVFISCPFVKTNGVGNYDEKMTINVTSDQGWSQLGDGVFVRQQNMGEDGWEYDERVWWVKAGLKQNGDALVPFYAVYPTEYDSAIGMYIPFENDPPRKEMTFTNTYTKSASEPTNPNETSSDANVSALPKTGDSSSLTGWLILLAVAAAAVAGVVVHGRRRKNAREE